MSYPKVCLNCDAPFEAKRDSARFCGQDCRNEWHTENRAASSETPGQRVTSHVLDEVRGLHEEHKGDWTTIIREHARRTLLVTGYLSAADFLALGVPDEHCNLPGAQIGAWAKAGYMEAIVFKRWSTEAKASRKSGKYWVYRITTKGKQKLSPQGPTAGPDTLNSEGSAATEVESAHGAAPSTGRAGLHPGVPHGAESSRSVRPGGGHDGAGPALPRKRGVESPTDTAAGSVSTPDSQGTLSSEGVPGVLQLDIPRESESSAYGTIVEDAA